jgi:hypothetical protein
VPQNAAAAAYALQYPSCGILVRGTVLGEAAASKWHHSSSLSVVLLLLLLLLLMLMVVVVVVVTGCAMGTRLPRFHLGDWREDASPCVPTAMGYRPRHASKARLVCEEKDAERAMPCGQRVKFRRVKF